MKANGDSRRRGGDVARHRPVGRRQPVRLRARPRRALQQHDAGGLGAADDGAGQESRAARSVPGGPARQRPGAQVVLARSFGGVRRRTRADRPAEAAEPAGRRLLVRPDFYSTATGKTIPLSPLGGRDLLGLRRRRAGAAGGIPGNKIVRQGIYHAGRRLHARRRSRRSAALLEQPVAAAADGRRARTELGRGVRQPVRQARRRRQRDALLQGAVRRRGAPLLPHRPTAPSSRRSATTTSSTGTQKAQLGIVGNVAYQFTPNHRLAFENFYSHSGRDEGRFFEGPNIENARYYRNYRLQFIEEGLISNARRRRALLPATGATAASTGA